MDLLVSGVVDFAANRSPIRAKVSLRLQRRRGASLFWHVKNKEALFGLMCEQIFRECLAQVPESRDLGEWLRNYGIVIWRKQ